MTRQEELNDAVGFSRVVHAISKSVSPRRNPFEMASLLGANALYCSTGEAGGWSQHVAGRDAHDPPVLLPPARGRPFNMLPAVVPRVFATDVIGLLLRSFKTLKKSRCVSSRGKVLSQAT